MTNPFDLNHCKNGHVFYWSGGDTTGQPPQGLKCACGLLTLGSAKGLAFDPLTGYGTGSNNSTGDKPSG